MILLLENVQDRIGGIEKSGIKFAEYSDRIKVFLYDEKCNEILKYFLENPHDFDKYDTIMIHESIYEGGERESLFGVLEKYTVKENKSLVKFSGFNTQASFSNNILTLSPTKLYENLETFLIEYKNDNSNILMLAYGKHWDLNPLLNNLEKLNIFIENYQEDDKIRAAKFKKEFGFFELKKILMEKDYRVLFGNISFEDKVSIKEMESLAANFKRLIKEKAND